MFLIRVISQWMAQFPPGVPRNISGKKTSSEANEADRCQYCGQLRPERGGKWNLMGIAGVGGDRLGQHHLDHPCCWGSKERQDRKSRRLNSSHLVISYAVFCLKK